jgi:hypothetical protein
LNSVIYYILGTVFCGIFVPIVARDPHREVAIGAKSLVKVRSGRLEGVREAEADIHPDADDTAAMILMICFVKR